MESRFIFYSIKEILSNIKLLKNICLKRIKIKYTIKEHKELRFLLIS